MKLSRDSVLALQRHFLGALRAPARTWLEPLPSTPLLFLGAAIRLDTLDLGSVSSPGEERSRVRVCSRSAQRIDVRIAEVPSWLTARWLGVEGDSVVMHGGDAGAPLEVRVIHDDERELHGALRFAVGSHVEELPVRMIAGVHTRWRCSTSTVPPFRTPSTSEPLTARTPCRWRMPRRFRSS